MNQNFSTLADGLNARTLNWVAVTGTSATGLANHGYITDNASRVQVSLPATCAVGDRFAVTGRGAGGWKVTQAAGQTIRFRGIDTPVGAAGYLQSSSASDGVELLCYTANTAWQMVHFSGSVGYDATTFEYTGAPQSYVVPGFATQIVVDVYGAAGGRSQPNQATGATGGKGGHVRATIPVTPGETLLVYVGGQGVSRNAGGWNGGGEGGHHTSYQAAAQGGGASDIRRTAAIMDRIVIAGGGGGGGYDQNPSVGGAGGGLIGGDGVFHPSDAASGGKGGTASLGGAAGTYSGYTTSLAGTLGVGGNSRAVGSTSAFNSGGGGGGGYYGGGAGTWGGGGGGSSYTLPGATNVTHTLGIREGHGKVVISFP